MTSKHIAFAFISVLFSAACGDSHEEENPDVEACEHLQEGPAAPVTAAADSAGAPAVADDHKRYDVTLPSLSGGGGNGGFVSFAAGEATDFIFFLDADVPVVFRDGAGAAITPEEKLTSSTECTEINARYTVPLAVGTLALELGPTSETEVSIVIEEAGHPHAE